MFYFLPLEGTTNKWLRKISTWLASRISLIHLAPPKPKIESQILNLNKSTFSVNVRQNSIDSNLYPADQGKRLTQLHLKCQKFIKTYFHFRAYSTTSRFFSYGKIVCIVFDNTLTHHKHLAPFHKQPKAITLVRSLFIYVWPKLSSI